MVSLRKTVVCDLDSSLAGFCAAFTGVALEMGATDRVYREHERDGWGFDFSASKVWERVYAARHFWDTLEPLWTPEEQPLLDAVGEAFHVLYVTGRDATKGTTVTQTYDWIDAVGLPSGPVFFAPHGTDKDEIVLPHRHQIAAMLEDKPSILESLSRGGVPMVARSWPYNRHVAGVEHVTSVGEFAEFALLRREA